jgi:S-methylmethionine-dependent homocysteine/selenocysteine methylase
MVNCAHPDHFSSALFGGGDLIGRIGGLRANASRCSHAELDAMTELDDGDPLELGRLYAALRQRLPQIRLLGGCCGTDVRHITAIAQACATDTRAIQAA